MVVLYLSLDNGVNIISSEKVDELESAVHVLCALGYQEAECVVALVVSVSLRVSRERNECELRNGVEDVVVYALGVLELLGSSNVGPLRLHAEEQKSVALSCESLRRYPVAEFLAVGNTVTA